MQPVTHTINSVGNTTCMQAALASMFHLPPEAVPDFARKHDTVDHEAEVKEFLLTQGVALVRVHKAKDVEDVYKELKETRTYNGCIYAVVISNDPLEFLHAVLVNPKGDIIHDPRPNKSIKGSNVLDTQTLNFWYELINVPKPI